MTELIKPAKVDFEVEIPVRIYDINYGGHLGHAELIKITHQARLQFFSKFSLKRRQSRRFWGYCKKSIRSL